MAICMAIENVLDSDSFSKPIVTIDRDQRQHARLSPFPPRTARNRGNHRKIKGLKKNHKFMEFRDGFYPLYVSGVVLLLYCISL